MVCKEARCLFTYAYFCGKVSTRGSKNKNDALMDTQKNQVADRLKQATNVLVTVSTNPSVDQLAGAIGLTLLLNKLGKHATAVFSGTIPSTIEFLQPEKTLEKTTDSLRDFIIALDKSKADKLRYKVEDQMVKIFITPYKTSITDKDLEFSQGDFNVDVVMALGVQEQKDVDAAITAHGRILHDATVIVVNTHGETKLGNVNWTQLESSSLCEMLVDMGLDMKQDVLDGQMATAFLTGIVAETNRFSNEKTSSLTMQMSAKLMTAGANQQLVASQLQPKEPVTPAHSEDAELPEVVQTIPQNKPDSPLKKTEKPTGALEIDHGEPEPKKEEAESETEDEEDKQDEPDQIIIDKEGQLIPLQKDEDKKPDASDTAQNDPEPASSRLITQAPTLGGTLTANSRPEALDPSTDPLGANAAHGPILMHDAPAQDTNIPISTEQKDADTLADLEKAVGSPHVAQAQDTDNIAPTQPDNVNTARDAVTQAVSATTPQILEPVYSLNARPMDINLPSNSAAPPTLPAGLVHPDQGLPTDTTATKVNNPMAPPPVPPPMMPPNLGPTGDNTQSNTGTISGVAL